MAQDPYRKAATRPDVEPQGAALGHAVIADHKRRRGAPWTMPVAARPDIEPQGAALGHAVIDQHHQQRRDAARPGLEPHAERDQPPGHIVQALGERPADERSAEPTETPAATAELQGLRDLHAASFPTAMTPEPPTAQTTRARPSSTPQATREGDHDRGR